MLVLPHNLDAAIMDLKSKPAVALDTETTGLRQFDKPFALVASHESESYVFDSRILPGNFVGSLANEIGEGKSLIYQNAKYDMRMGATAPGAVYEDIEVLSRLVRNDHMKYSLEAQAQREGGEEKIDIIQYIKEHGLTSKRPYKYSDGCEDLLHFDQVPIPVMASYAAMDGRLTFDLRKSHLAKLDPRSFPVWEMEKKLTPVCFAMERRGLLLDRDYTIKAMQAEECLIREAKQSFRDLTGLDYAISKAELVDLFKKAGEKVPKTKTGRDSLTDDILESFTSPAAKLVQKVRHHEKRVSTYYSSFLELEYNGVIHPDMRQAGTTTGRFSYREPNLQNMPKDENSTDEYVVRGCFKPRDGYVYVSFDFLQMEYRMMLAYANHEQMIKAVMAGHDVHQATADLIGRITRSQAKTLNFAILYGAGADKLSKMLGVSVPTARALKKLYFDRLIQVEDLIFKVTKIGAERGHIYNWMGRKLHISNANLAYILPNHLIQSGCADVCKIAMVACAEELRQWDCHTILQVHDQLIFEIREADITELVPKLARIMEDSAPEKNGMRMGVDITWSRTSMADRDLKQWGPDGTSH